MLLPTLADPSDVEALRFGARALTYRELRGAAGAVVQAVAGRERVAVWAQNELETCVAVVGALAAGAAVVPLNPRSGARELVHVVGDSAPGCVLAAPGAELAPQLAGVARVDVDVAARVAGPLPAEASAEAPALVVYTSGTTGAPKGVVLPRRALAANLDALYDVWGWTAADKLVQALPLFHVHGLGIGVLGSLRRGARMEHTGRFSAPAVAAVLARDATMLFGVPTMYHRLAQEAAEDPSIAAALGRARLLVSGSAALPAVLHERVERLTGQRIVERYGMSETLMNVAVRHDGDRRPGYVGLPLPGVEVELRDDDGARLEVGDDETIGELVVRGPNLFTGYLNRPEATAAAMRDGWFHTGDLATRAPDGYLRIVGRRATDLIKSAGYKIGAGEIEGALLEHPAVVEVAVTGEPDEELGERVVAWVVAADGAARPEPAELAAHVGALLAAHKRPREVRYLDALPRNDLGKVRKTLLRPGAEAPRAGAAAPARGASAVGVDRRTPRSGVGGSPR